MASENIANDEFNTGDVEIAKNKIEELQYWIAGELRSLGYNVDTNQFTPKELNDLTNKVDKIIEAFKDILTASGLGKKSVSQRITGVVIGYVAEKGADEVYEAIKHSFS